MARALDEIDWDQCIRQYGGARCTGVALGVDGLCLRHADDEQRGAVLSDLRRGRRLDCARGVGIDGSLLATILACAPKDVTGRPLLEGADFTRATFEESADFDDVILEDARFTAATFRSDASFLDAVFRGWAEFDRAVFESGARFGDSWIEDGTERDRHATFQGQASFRDAEFGDGGDANFDYAVFEGPADFEHAAFAARASFERATFHDRGRFTPPGTVLATSGPGPWSQSQLDLACTFHKDAIFDGAHFRGDGQFLAVFRDVASFKDVTFERQAWFNPAVFEGTAYFWATIFNDTAWFVRAAFRDAFFYDGTLFRGPVWFDSATFGGQVSFDGATFQSEASFRETVFAESGSVTLGGAAFRDGVRFEDTVFDGDLDLSALTLSDRARVQLRARGEQVTLDDAEFEGFVEITAESRGLSCVRTRFLGGGHLEVRNADIALDDAQFPAPVVISAGGSGAASEGTQARVVSLRGANVAGLTLAGVSLRACRFHGAHNLDRLGLEGEGLFADAPKTWWWTPRHVLAEEHEWRRKVLLPNASRGKGWLPPECQSPEWLEAEPLEPELVAPIYRSLRKAEEDRKNEPGAADFYYGEMEMRRAASRRTDGGRRRRAEWLVLSLYWLVSGYGLRAGRALLALVVTVIVFTGLFYAGGLEERDLSTALLETVEAAAFRAGDRSVLSEAGEYLTVPLRLLGPLFVGLALLSLRAHIRR